MVIWSDQTFGGLNWGHTIVKCIPSTQLHNVRLTSYDDVDHHSDTMKHLNFIILNLQPTACTLTVTLPLDVNLTLFYYHSWGRICVNSNIVLYNVHLSTVRYFEHGNMCKMWMPFHTKHSDLIKGQARSTNLVSHRPYIDFPTERTCCDVTSSHITCLWGGIHTYCAGMIGWLAGRNALVSIILRWWHCGAYI